MPPVAEAVARQIAKVLRWRIAKLGNGCLLKGRATKVTGILNAVRGM